MLLRQYLEPGLSKAQIARTLDVSRRTVCHWIACITADGQSAYGAS